MPTSVREVMRHIFFLYVFMNDPPLPLGIGHGLNCDGHALARRSPVGLSMVSAVVSSIAVVFGGVRFDIGP